MWLNGWEFDASMTRSTSRPSASACAGELVGEGDVQVAVGRLGELRQLGRLRRAHRPHVGVEERAVELDAARLAALAEAADELRVRREVAQHAAAEHALGAEDDPEVLLGAQARCAPRAPARCARASCRRGRSSRSRRSCPLAGPRRCRRRPRRGRPSRAARRRRRRAAGRRRRAPGPSATAAVVSVVARRRPPRDGLAPAPPRGPPRRGTASGPRSRGRRRARRCRSR